MIRRLADWLRDERGAIAPILVLLLIPMIGMMALGGEVTSWYMKQRQIQNAADTAALAAATNNTTTNVSGVPGYQREAFGAAGQFGFQHVAAGDVQVLPSITDCPGSAAGTNDCYQVLIEQKVPLYLTQVVGYRGTTTMSGDRPATWLQAVAIARPRGQTSEYCLVGLDTSGTSFRINGGSHTNFNGCSMKSNSGATCNGANSDNNMSFGDGTSGSSCGNPSRTTPALTDPYLLLNTSPPVPSPPAGCTVTSSTPVTTITSVASTPYCGSVKLGSDINITSPDTKLTVYDGNLDLNGHTLSTQGTGSMTIILTGTRHQGGSLTVDHTITGSGTVDITAPTSGTAAVSGGLKGVAILQDKRINPGNKDVVDFTYSGNTPTLAITGLIYMPNSNFTLKGAINHRTGYLYCVSVVTKTILADGTGALYANSSKDCHVNNFLTGLDVPGTNVRQALVQ